MHVWHGGIPLGTSWRIASPYNLTGSGWWARLARSRRGGPGLIRADVPATCGRTGKPIEVVADVDPVARLKRGEDGLGIRDSPAYGRRRGEQMVVPSRRIHKLRVGLHAP